MSERSGEPGWCLIESFATHLFLSIGWVLASVVSARLSEETCSACFTTANLKKYQLSMAVVAARRD